MEQRIDFIQHAQEAHESVCLGEVHCDLRPGSQADSFTENAHFQDARALGETEHRRYPLDAWRETPFYTDRERAALAWAEQPTRVSETHVPDETYEAVKKQFSEKEIVDRSIQVSTINVWNRWRSLHARLPERIR